MFSKGVDFFSRFERAGYAIISITAAFVFGWLITILFFKMIRFLEKDDAPDIFDAIRTHLKRPLSIFMPLLLILLISPTFNLSDRLLAFFRHLFSIMLILTMAWLSMNALKVIRDMVILKNDINTQDNLRVRQILTRIKIIERIVFIIILIITTAMLLMTFDRVKQLGVSILASAGVIGIVIGFSAQKTLATMFAGLQIAFTQPFRLDDVVIVENEWGRIEDITLTYVVVRIWDMRRLILPITYFIEKPFQNWTRISADILGTVFLYTDYTVPIDDLRREFDRILKKSELWDGKVSNIQVTDANPSNIQIRALMSAEDASKAWDLRCLIREKLIAFLQTRYPESLPKSRVELKTPMQDNHTLSAEPKPQEV